MTDVERCICCGEIIPEGLMVCPNCLLTVKSVEEAGGKVALKKGKDKMKMKVVLDPGAIMPTRAHETDAGLDLYAREKHLIPCGESMCFDTGVHVEIPAGYVGMIKSKSGLNVRFGVTSEGVIDSGYTGSIMVKLYNHGDHWVEIEKGQKISQLVLLPIITPELELVDSLEDTERGNGGFGSTGKF